MLKFYTVVMGVLDIVEFGAARFVGLFDVVVILLCFCDAYKVLLFVDLLMYFGIVGVCASDLLVVVGFSVLRVVLVLVL